MYNNSAHGIGISGLSGTGVIDANATDSLATNNGLAGFAVSSGVGFGTSSFMIIRSVTANNATGIVATNNPTDLGLGPANLGIGQSTVFGNGKGWDGNYPAFNTGGDNNIFNNAVNNNFDLFGQYRRQ